VRSCAQVSRQRAGRMGSDGRHQTQARASASPAAHCLPHKLPTQGRVGVGNAQTRQTFLAARTLSCNRATETWLKICGDARAAAMYPPCLPHALRCVERAAFPKINTGHVIMRKDDVTDALRPWSALHASPTSSCRSPVGNSVCPCGLTLD
jgi:hypothetical protein